MRSYEEQLVYERARSKAYREKNREKVNARAREWRNKNPDRVAAANARYWLRRCQKENIDI